MDLNPTKKENYLITLKKALRAAAFYIFLFSASINIIMLILPIYSLQVFDRVMSSGSIETLVSLTIIAAFLFVMFGIFNGIREVILIKISGWLDKKIGSKIFKLSINHSSVTGDKLGSSFFSDAQTVRQFVTSPTIFSIFDLPWSFLFIFVIYLISPQISLLVSGGAAILFALTFFREFKNKADIKETNEINQDNMRRVDEYVRYSETIEAMGMLPQAYNIWAENQQMVIERTHHTSVFSSLLNSFAKSLRMMLQISIIGLGTYLALQKQMTFGGIIACSILSGRALAPFEAIMSIWGSLSNVRDAYQRLDGFFDQAIERPETINLQKPTGLIELEKVVFVKQAGMMPVPIIKGVDLKIEAGDVVGIIGPSASGKSTLIKLVAGIYKPFQGVVKIDGGDAFQRNRDDIGKYIGYLPQSIDLLKGSIAQNISRFDPDATDEDIIKAAKTCGVHDLVLSFSEGYGTIIGGGAVELSGGQKQRVALARAFYGEPEIIILDEPNANLDEVGERMLLNAIIAAKKAGKTLIMISHKPAIINITDKIAVIRDGALMDYGSTKEIMSKYARNSGKMKSYNKAVDEARHVKKQTEAIPASDVNKPQENAQPKKLSGESSGSQHNPQPRARSQKEASPKENMVKGDKNVVEEVGELENKETKETK